MARPVSGGGGPKRRPRRTPSPTQRARAQQQQYVSQGKAVQHAATGQRRQARQRAAAAPRSNVVGTSPFRTTSTGATRAVTPIKKIQRQQHDRTRRAAAKLPDHQLPRFPLLDRYTPAQRETIIQSQRHRLSQIRRQTGATVTDIFERSGRSDRQQLDLLRRVEERQYGAARRAQNARDRVKAGRGQDHPSGQIKIAGIPIGSLSGSPLGIPLAVGGTTGFQLLRATAEDPAAVARSSVRTGVESIAGIPQGIKMIAKHPHEALKAIAKDYEDRYGPILEGNGAEFRRRVKSDYGLTPYALDALAVVGGGGQAAGLIARSGPYARAVQALKTAADTSHAPGLRSAARAAEAVRQTATRERPALRYSGGEAGARPQQTSRNLVVAAGQQALDVGRGRLWERRLQKAGLEQLPSGALRRTGRKAPERLPALRPGPGEVLPGARLGGRGDFLGVTVPSARELPLLRRYTGRVARELGGRQSVQRVRMLSHRGRVGSEIRKVTDRLDGHEKQALKYMTELGVTPDEHGIRALQQRLAQMTRARKQEGRSIAPILADSNDEVALIRRILKAPDRYLTPKLRAAADDLRTIQLREAARDPDLPAERELIQRYTKQADLLGVPRRAATREGQQVLDQVRAIADRTGEQVPTSTGRAARQVLEPVDDAAKFAERTRKAAGEAGLSEPAYWMSSARPENMPSLAAVGRGMRAAHRSRQYTGSLHRIGAEEHGADVFTKGVERNIKRRFGWALVARNLDTHVFHWSRGRQGEGMNIGEIKRELDRRMIDPGTVQIVDTRIARHGPQDPAAAARGQVLEPDVEDLQIESSADLASLKQDMPAELTPQEIQAHAMNRYLVVPKEVGEAVDGAAVKLDGTATRALEVILKQKPARILLGALNAPWLAFQVASNALLTGLGGGTNPLDIYGAHKWWRGLDPEAREAIDAELGITHGHHFALDQPHLGKTNSRMVAFWRGYKASKVGRRAHQMNPLDAMFRADEAQNNFFRRTLFYNQARKAAYRRMGQSWRGIDTGISRATERVLALPPDRQAAMIARHGPEFEQTAKHVRNFLGDYLQFSPSERMLLSRNVMFYGYLRFSLRFAFYTMPIQHPVMAAILGDVGRMGSQEIKDLFGVPSNYRLPTSMLANTYFGNRADAKQGRLRQIPVGRFNPFLNTITQLQSEQQAVGLVSPIYQALVDQLFEESSFTGRDWQINGIPTPSQSERPSDYYGSIAGALIPGRPRNRILTRSLLELAYPYRVAEKTGIPGVVPPLEGPQGDDSLVFSQRPIGYRDPATVKSIRRSVREQRARGTVGPLLDQLLPGIRPQVTRSPDVVAREREKEAAATEAQRRARMSPSARKALERRNRSQAAKKAARTRRRRGGSGSFYGGSSQTGSARYGGSSSSASRYGG